MPTIYSGNERIDLEQKFLDQAHTLFAQKGFLKTSIGEITRAVGVAAGTFYNYFTSKEALFFEIMGEAEKRRFKIIKKLFTKDGDPKEEFRTFLKETFSYFIDDPVYQWLYSENLFERIVRKIPEHKLLQHLKYDIDAAKAILASTQPRSYLCGLTPDELVSQLRALFLQTIHQEEIGVEDMKEFMLQQIDIYVEGVTVIYGEVL